MNKEEDLETKVNEMKLYDQKDGKEGEINAKVEEEAEGEVKNMEVEAKTGVSFPVKLPDGKMLNTVGIRKKKILALGIHIYTFGIYADNAALGKLLVDKFTKAPEKPTKELYETVINSDVGMMVRLVIVFGGLTMSMVRKNFDEGLGSSIKKLNGGQKNDELVNKFMGAAKDSIKLPSGSIIEITRLPGYVIQTKIKDELVSSVESELLCRAYFHMYLGDDPFDKEAREKFGERLLTLF